jgi:hypothetical protein
MLLYEAGEALRLDEIAVRAGVRGIQNVMHALGMLSARFAVKPKAAPVFAKTSLWSRAPEGGLFRAFKTLGDSVTKGDIVGLVANPYESIDSEVVAPVNGIIIGRINIAVVNRADALFHIAEVQRPGAAETRIESISSELENDRGIDEEEIA